MTALGPMLRLISGLAFLVAACAPQPSVGGPQTSSAPQSLAPRRIVLAIMDNPPTLNERISTTGGGAVLGGAELERLVLTGLVRKDDRGVLRPQLAEAVPSTENGLWRVFPDGRMETTWRIRPDARWHDGAPFSSDDILFTAAVGQDRELPLTREAAYEYIEAIEARDPQTVTIRWKRPYIDADTMFDTSPMPRHLLGRAYAEDKPTFMAQPYWTQEFVGSGPFRLREWVLGSHLVLVAFDQYPLGRPHIDEIEVKFIPDSNTLLANVLAGAVDLTMGRGFSIEQATQAQSQWRDGAVGLEYTSWLVIYPQFLNPNPPIVANLQVRQALYHSIDRQQIVDAIQAGLVPVAHIFLNPRESEYREIESSIVRYDYDPRRAAQLMDGLGYVKGSDGIYRDAAGQRLSWELRTIETDINQKTMLSVADYWQRLGVAVDPVVVPRARQRDNEYRANFPAFDLLRQPNDLASLERLHSTRARLPENSYVGTNYSRYMNPEFDSLIERFFTTIPRRERMEVLAQAVRHVTERLTLMGLFYDAQPTMVSNRLRNVTPEDTGWNAHEWVVV